MRNTFFKDYNPCVGVGKDKQGGGWRRWRRSVVGLSMVVDEEEGQEGNVRAALKGQAESKWG